MTPIHTRSTGEPFLHYELKVGPDDLIEVLLDSWANVLLLDAENYEHYQSNRPYRYAKGGYVEHSPFRLRAPSHGTWHLVIDLGGGPGHVRPWVRIFSEPTHPEETSHAQEKR